MSDQEVIDVFLASYPAEVVDLAHAARGLLKELLPGALETLDRTAKVIGYSYGPGYKGTVCASHLEQGRRQDRSFPRLGAARPQGSAARRGQGASSYPASDPCRSEAARAEAVDQGRAFGVEGQEQGRGLIRKELDKELDKEGTKAGTEKLALECGRSPTELQLVQTFPGFLASLEKIRIPHY